MSAKIAADHLARGAVVYVRQSTMTQVLGNLESQKRQYALADGQARTRFRGAARAGWAFTLAASAYDLISSPSCCRARRESRPPSLLTPPTPQRHRPCPGQTRAGKRGRRPAAHPEPSNLPSGSNASIDHHFRNLLGPMLRENRLRTVAPATIGPRPTRASRSRVWRYQAQRWRR